MKINQTNGLNRKARKFLLEHCVSKKGAEIMGFGFNGFINGTEVNDATLMRIEGKWVIFSTKEIILSICGEIDCFQLTRNTIL